MCFSPNTPGLRDWQKKEQLEKLLSALIEARDGLNTKTKTPLLLKLAPDLSEKERREIAEIILKKSVSHL